MRGFAEARRTQAGRDRRRTYSATEPQPPEKNNRLDPDRAAIIRTAPPIVMNLKEASA
jgi:hypothetical protein